MLTTSEPSVSRCSRQCGILNVSQPYGLLRESSTSLYNNLIQFNHLLFIFQANSYKANYRQSTVQVHNGQTQYKVKIKLQKYIVAENKKKKQKSKDDEEDNYEMKTSGLRTELF
jgi:hypothetical protein